jgi:hypothetical protein
MGTAIHDADFRGADAVIDARHVAVTAGLFSGRRGGNKRGQVMG